MTAPRDPARPFLTCFSTMGCTELTLPQVLDLADRFSIDCLELRSLENRIDLPAYLSEQPGGLSAVRASLSRHPARVLGTSFKLVGDAEAGRTALLSFARLTEEGTYVRFGGLWCRMIADPRLEEPLVGYAIGRNFGGAVQRNRMRRRLRALLQTRGEQFRPGLYLIGANEASGSLTPVELTRSVEGLLEGVKKHYE